MALLLCPIRRSWNECFLGEANNIEMGWLFLPTCLLVDWFYNINLALFIMVCDFTPLGLGFRERERERERVLKWVAGKTIFLNWFVSTILRLTHKPHNHSLVEIDWAFDRRGLFGKLPRLVYQIDLRKKRGRRVSKCNDIKSQGVLVQLTQ